MAALGKGQEHTKSLSCPVMSAPVSRKQFWKPNLPLDPSSGLGFPLSTS